MVFMLFDNEVQEMVLKVRENGLIRMAVLRYNIRYRSHLHSMSISLSTCVYSSGYQSPGYQSVSMICFATWR